MTGCLILGVYYHLGAGVPRDLARGAALYRQACDGGLPEGCASLGQDLMAGLGGLPDPSGANHMFQRACDHGSADACARLGDNFLVGVGVPRDEGRGVELLRRACDAHNALGCEWLGVAYGQARGVVRDLPRARQLETTACGLESPTACVTLGNMVREGVGGPRDVPQAAGLFERACDAGNPTGCERLAELDQADPAGDQATIDALLQRACAAQVPSSDPTGGSPYVCAVTQGHMGITCWPPRYTACAALALRVESGEPARAASLMERACGGGIALACRSLASMYSLGHGVPQSDSEQVRWLREACRLGDAASCASPQTPAQ